VHNMIKTMGHGTTSSPRRDSYFTDENAVGTSS
jgi:hypothetical protein